MLLFQIILILFVLFALSRTALQFRKGKLPLPWFLVWVLVWIAVGVVAALPETTSRLAALVGVTRGVDLVVYVSIAVLFYLVFRVLVKIETLEQHITRVVRQVALDESEKKE